MSFSAGWGEIVGDDVAASSAPLRVANGTLLVAVRSSAWSHQLSFLSERIIESVRQRLPQAGIERLRFRVGSMPKRRAAVASPRQASLRTPDVAREPAQAREKH